MCLTDTRCHEPAAWPTASAFPMLQRAAFHWRGRAEPGPAHSLSNHSPRPAQRSLEAPRREDAPCSGPVAAGNCAQMRGTSPTARTTQALTSVQSLSRDTVVSVGLMLMVFSSMRLFREFPPGTEEGRRSIRPGDLML